MERLWNRNYCKVMAANFALFFAFYVLTPLLPLYLSEHFGATKDIIGLVLSGYTITALLLRPFSGYFVDSFPRKTVLMVCFTVFAIFFAGYLAASTLLMFTIVRTLHGGPFGALTVANSTVAIDVLPSSRRTEGIGYYGLSNNLAMALAPTIGIYVYHLTGSFELLFWIALAVAFAGLAIDATVVVRSHPAPVSFAATPCQPSPPRLSLDRFFLLRGWLLGANMVAFGFSFGVLSNYLAIYSKESIGITGGTGTYFMLCSIGLMLSRLQGSRALRQGRLTHNAGVGMIVSLVGYTLFILMPTLVHLSPLSSPLSCLSSPPSCHPCLLCCHPCLLCCHPCLLCCHPVAALTPHSLILLAYYGSALLIGLGNGHLWPAFQNMTISVARNNQRGTANSTILISWDIGMGIGVLAGGVIAELLGYDATFWTVVLINTVGVAVFFLWTKRFFLERNLNSSVR